MDPRVARWHALLAALLHKRLELRKPSPLLPAPLAVALALSSIAGIALAFDRLGVLTLGSSPDFVVRTFEVITELGDSGLYLVPAGVAIIALAFVAPTSRRLDAALRQISLRLGFLFVAVAGTGIAANIVKRSVGRLRPHHLAEGATIEIDPFAWATKTESFPSGHATTAAALAAILVLLYGRKGVPWALVLMVLVGLSRVVVGAHFISDVVAGTLLGWLGTVWFARFLARRGLVFRTSPTGALAPKGSYAAKALRSRITRAGAS
jgi:membrane-associated phospholipid phosphatase